MPTTTKVFSAEQHHQVVLALQARIEYLQRITSDRAGDSLDAFLLPQLEATQAALAVMLEG